MAINKKLIHFKKFSDFNSKKLSANEENTKYTVGVGGAVTTGAPDILYQSICWIKDTKQQWTHGELYDCDTDDVKPYVAFFTLLEIEQFAESGEGRQCSQEEYWGILEAVESSRPILIPNNSSSGGYAIVTNKVIDDCIYLTIVGAYGGGVPRFYDVEVWQGEVFFHETTYQNELVSGTNIKTVNGQSLLGSGNILTYNEYDFPFLLDVELSEIVESAENGTTFEYWESSYEELRTAIDQGRMVLVENLYDGSGRAVVVNQTASDMVYLTLVANLGSDATPRFYAVEIEGSVGSAREITYQQALVSGTNIKTINGESVLGSGDITISSGPSSGGSGAYSEVSHGTSDTTFTLTPNVFHVWDEVASLTLTLSDETAGVANEFLFQFNSGSTATTLTLPDSLKWANDSAPTIEANKIYQVSILKGLASMLVFSNTTIISFTISGTEYQAEEGMTWGEWVMSGYNKDGWVVVSNQIRDNSSIYVYNYITNVTPDLTILRQAYSTMSGNNSGGGSAA